MSLSVCRLCRREGIKLFLKGDRCFTDKCAIERRAYIPGQHGNRRSKQSDYALMLREKQKVKRIYGIRERQFRRYFEMASREKGITGENLILLLERRLDNIVYRLGLARSRAEARQLVGHGHVRVNGRKVDIPSYLAIKGSQIHVSERGKQFVTVVESVEGAERRGIPDWLKLDKENFLGTIVAFPRREQITLPIQEQLIVEYYSK